MNSGAAKRASHACAHEQVNFGLTMIPPAQFSRARKIYTSMERVNAFGSIHIAKEPAPGWYSVVQSHGPETPPTAHWSITVRHARGQGVQHERSRTRT